jgi:hypothetical protein
MRSTHYVLFKAEKVLNLKSFLIDNKLLNNNLHNIFKLNFIFQIKFLNL